MGLTPFLEIKEKLVLHNLILKTQVALELLLKIVAP